MRAEQDGYNWPTLGQQFRSKHTQKLKMTPNDNSDTMAYLKKLVLQMIDADGKRDRPSNADATQLSGLLRTVPTLSHESLNPLALAAKQALDQSVTAAATQGDDPWLLFLEKEYLSKLCFLVDIAARHKLFRVAKISYWPSTKERYANWEATLEPVHIDAQGDPFVADDDVVQGPKGKTIFLPNPSQTTNLTLIEPILGLRLTKSAKLLGYILAQYIDGDDEEPTRTECVDLYIEDALPKHRAYKHRRDKDLPP